MEINISMESMVAVIRALKKTTINDDELLDCLF